MKTPLCLLALLVACGTDSNGNNDASANSDGGRDAAPPGPDLAMRVGSPRDFTMRLGGAHAGHFLVGTANDGTDSGNDPTYALGVTLDLHDHYLVGLSTEGGWPTWNSNPDYAGKRIGEAVAHGVVPMLTQYCMRAHGENNLPGSIGDAAYMTVYWRDWAQLLATVAAANTPVVLHLEPDFWGYLQFAAMDAGGVDKVPAKVAVSGFPECAGLPETPVGFGRCLVATAHARAPRALVGFHASGWSSKMDVLESAGGVDVATEAAKTIAFLRTVGAADADFIATDLLDRDAGCYEVGYVDGKGNTICSVRPGLYWDESNTTLPHFHQAWAWSGAIAAGLDLPMIWWQIPMGEPASSSGVVDHFRDNRVHYMFAHVPELVSAHGVAMVFGPGAGGQTSLTTDNNQFKTAAGAYYAAPVLLP